jgi:hypothetical protein
MLGLKKFVVTHELEDNMVFLIREHRRKFQLGVSHCTVWRLANPPAE